MNRLRRWIESIAQQRAEKVVDDARTVGGYYHVLTLRFEKSDRAVDIPFEPWAPRQTITLPGRWVEDA